MSNLSILGSGGGGGEGEREGDRPFLGVIGTTGSKDGSFWVLIPIGLISSLATVSPPPETQKKNESKKTGTSLDQTYVTVAGIF